MRTSPNGPDAQAELSTDVIVQLQLDEVHRRYGDEKGGGAFWLPFHNATHSTEVHGATQFGGALLVRAGLITSQQLRNVRIAAAGHDLEQREGSGRNEILSAHEVADSMRTFETFSDEDVRTMTTTLVGTMVTIAPNGSIIQTVNHADILQGLLADADLCAFGMPVGPKRALMLFGEFQILKGQLPHVNTYRELTRLEPNRDQLVEFLTVQKRLLLDHKYFTPVFATLQDQQLVRNANFSAQLVEDVESGASYGTILQKADRFSRKTAKQPQQVLVA